MKEDYFKINLLNPLIIGDIYHYEIIKAIKKQEEVEILFSKILESQTIKLRILQKDLSLLLKDGWDFEVKEYGYIRAFNKKLLYKTDKYSSQREEIANYLEKLGVVNVVDMWTEKDIQSLLNDKKALTTKDEYEIFKTLENIEADEKKS